MNPGSDPRVRWADDENRTRARGSKQGTIVGRARARGDATNELFLLGRGPSVRGRAARICGGISADASSVAPAQAAGRRAAFADERSSAMSATSLAVRAAACGAFRTRSAAIHSYVRAGSTPCVTTPKPGNQEQTTSDDPPREVAWTYWYSGRQVGHPLLLHVQYSL
jgi:hypothetical protein